MRKVTVIYGTRPEAIKVAPLVRRMRVDSSLQVQVTSTGQHQEMVAPIEEALGLRPDANLALMQHGQGLTELFARVASGVDAVIARERPDAVVVHGDTTSAAAAAMAAFHRSVPVVHLEAGLRSGDLMSPFPEEGNRRMIAQVASLHLAPTSRARDNLLCSGTSSSDVVVTGNTVVDALLWADQIASSQEWPSDLAPLAMAAPSTKVVLVTLHRRENLDGRIGRVCRALARVAAQYPELLIVFPMHRNPLVRQIVRAELADFENVLLIEPLGYLTTARVLRRSALVLTDSGGLQEEAPSFGVPVLVARDTTERPEAVAAGCARLVGDDVSLICESITETLATAHRYSDGRTVTAANPFGDGRAAERAVHAIKELLGVGTRVAEFRGSGTGTTFDPSATVSSW